MSFRAKQQVTACIYNVWIKKKKKSLVFFFFPTVRTFLLLLTTNVYLVHSRWHTARCLECLVCFLTKAVRELHIYIYEHRLTDLILFVVLHRSLMALSLHRSRCTFSMKSSCSATRTFPTLTQHPQVQIIHNGKYSLQKDASNMFS